MPTETARVPGPAPVLFTDSSDDLSFFEGFILGSSPDAQTGFGAQQAILVRSDAMAEALESRLEGLCPILTIAGSKGLEFDDILIYNFFGHSLASTEEWGLVSSGAEHDSHADNQSPASPVLCIELKMLYVALTRARKRCWIWDSGDTINEIKNCLLTQNLITTTSTSEFVGQIGVNSTSTQWIEKGQEYFSCSLYKLAAACFRRAGRQADANASSAYHRMTRAKLKHLRYDDDSSRHGLIQAANDMQQCAIESFGQDARHFWFHAATCFQLAGRLDPASNAFVMGGFYGQAVNILFEHDGFDRGSRILLAYKDSIETEVGDDLLDQARQYFFQTSDYKSLSRVFFHNLEDQLNYAREHEYHPQRKYLLKSYERFDELLDLYLEEKAFAAYVECCITAYHKDGNLARLELAANTTIDYAQAILLLEGRNRELARRDLLGVVNRIIVYIGYVSQEKQKWIKFVSSLVKPEHVQLDVAKMWNPDISSEIAPRTLALHFALTDLEWIESFSWHGILRHLYAWGVHTATIIKLFKRTNPSSSKVVRLLLGLRLPSSDQYTTPRAVVLEDSPILVAARRENLDISASHRVGEYIMRTTAVDRLIKSEMVLLLHIRLHDLHSGLLQSLWTRSFYTPRHLPTLSTSQGEPVAPGEGFKQRLNIVTLAMCDLTPIRISGSGRHNIARIWIRRLHDLVYPISGFEENVFLLSSLPKHELLEDSISRYLSVAATELDLENERPADFFASLVSVLSLSALLDRPGLDRYAAEEHRLHAYTGLMHLDDSGRGDSLIMDVVEFFRMGSPDSLANIVSVLKYVLDSDIHMDAAVLVHLVELITREMIFSLRANKSTTSDGFDNLILPRSWAKGLARVENSSRAVRNTGCLDSFLDVLGQLSAELKFGTHRRWTVDGAALYNKVEVLHMINLRLCWCAALFVPNISSSHASAALSLRVLKDIADNTSPARSARRHCGKTTPFDVFFNTGDAFSCIRSLKGTLHHEPLVLLTNGQSASQFRGYVSTIWYTERSELSEIL
ncbi:hypothetical protein FRC12_014131 [Ceratobasidium sp. 428]|nr:hypothetical protein FRC12_014131 [Ceratobasidium sp. 428]